MKALIPLLAAILACAPLPGAPSFPTEADADASVYRVIDGTVSGTAWVVAPGVLITAGHLCLDDAIHGRAPIWVVKGTRAWAAEVVEFEMSENASADMCVLRASVPGAPLPLVATAPEEGETVTVIGFPLSVHTITHGVVTHPDEDGEAATSAPVDHGSSGGPAMTAHGVYGCVVSVGGALTPAAEIKRVLDELSVPYGVR